MKENMTKEEISKEMQRVQAALLKWGEQERERQAKRRAHLRLVGGTDIDDKTA